MLDSALLSEAHRRFTRHGEVRAMADDFIERVRRELMPVQESVIADKSRSKSVRCPRRAGKTTLTPAYLAINSAQTGELNQFWGISRMRAKELAWEPLLQLIQRHGVTVEKNDTELSIRWPWSPRAFTRLKGADKEKETHKKRGDRLGLAIVDEAQLMPQYLKVLVEDVLEPATQDVRGTICLMGTPGVICSGFWYDVSRNERDKVAPGWELHHWHVRDNVAMPHLWEENLALKARRGWDDENPTWIREYLGQWVNDAGALFYAYDDARNGIDTVPVLPMSYVLGWDLGSGGENDPMGLHVWGFSPDSPILWPVASWKDPNAGLEQTMAEVTRLESKLGGFAREVADTGGSGKVAVNYVNQRFGRNFEPAAKTAKFEHVVMFNDDLRRGVVKVLRGSPLALELAQLPRDPDDPTKEHEAYANHCADAALYAWREARHFWGEVPVPPPKPGSPEALAEQEREMERQLLEAAQEEDEFQKGWGF